MQIKSINRNFMPAIDKIFEGDIIVNFKGNQVLQSSIKNSAHKVQLYYFKVAYDALINPIMLEQQKINEIDNSTERELAQNELNNLDVDFPKLNWEFISCVDFTPNELAALATIIDNFPS